MSKANRRKVYDRLVAEGRLDKDDGALVKEFGEPKTPPKFEEPKTPTSNPVLKGAFKGVKMVKK